MTRIAVAEVQRIAELARLELGDAEAARMARELEAILGYVESLRAVDTSGVEPTLHAMGPEASDGRALRGVLATPLRDDRAEPPLDAERALANAPERDGFAFVVPRVLDEDDA